MTMILDEVSDEHISLLIRMALGYEASRKSLRRDDIISTVLGEGNGRLFRDLLSQTNERMKEVFGMQLVTLPTVSKLQNTLTVAGRKAATSAASRKAEVSQSTCYILQNTLPNRPATTFHPSLDRLAITAIVVTMLHLSGENGLEEDSLISKLRSFSVESTFGRLDELLSDLKRQKYISASKKSDDQGILLYFVGPRAMIEFPPEYLAKFVMDLAQFTGRSTDELRPRLVNVFKLEK